MSNSVSDMMSEAVKNIKGLIDANTVIGDAINTPDGSVIIPISKVTFGFGGGGSELSSKKENGEPLFGGGMGGGASVQAEAFMVISDGNVRIVPVNAGNSPINKLIDMVPEAVDKVNSFFSKNKQDNGFGDN